MQPEPRRYTEEEYFALDEAAPEGVRLEYFDGYVYHKGRLYDPDLPDLARAMAGGTKEHNRISANALVLLAGQLRERDCDVLPSDQWVRLPDGRYVYPDVVASCDPQYEDEQILNPQLLVEVVSESTAHEDLGRKMEAYTQIESLHEYWVVEQQEVRVTCCYRTADGWGLRHYTDLDETIRSDHLDIEVALAELYRRVFEKR